MAPKRAGVQVDHTSPEIEFVHEALGDTSVTVRQSLGPLGDGRDATARWVWDGAAPMAEFLCEHPERVRGKTVVELGAGPGLPGIVAARLGAARVVLTDLPGELELLKENAAKNGVAATAAAAACAWGDARAVSALGRFDVVLCSDVLYGHLETTAIALAETAHALCEPRAGAVFLSYFPREKLEAERHPAVRRSVSRPVPRDVGGCARRRRLVVLRVQPLFRAQRVTDYVLLIRGARRSFVVRAACP